VDVLGIVNITVAAIAVTLSLIALNSSRRQQRFDAILRVDEFLLQGDVVHGRRLLYESSQRGKLPADQEEDIHTMVRAITRFDSAAILVKNGLVPKSWMLETWHLALQQLHPGLLLIVNYQHDNWGIGNAWPTLTNLIEEARKFKCQEVCCRKDPEEVQTRRKNGE
jgi:hypothetical protein